jgi:hypothetical protein
MIIAGYKIYGIINIKEGEVDKDDLALRYRQQNGAFFDWHTAEGYLPYDKEFEWKMQVHINFYMKYTGKTVTVGDVETFLANPENPNGTPRTWKDDRTGVISDFVEWFWSGQSIDEFRFYEDRLFGILLDYRDAHPGCPYTTLSKLTPEQIIELDKKLLNPDYVLVLPVQ